MVDRVLAELGDQRGRVVLVIDDLHELRAPDALAQVTLEQAHHVGELIALFWQQDVEPPEMTWIDVRLLIKGDPGPS